MASDPQTWAELQTAIQDFLQNTVQIDATRAKQCIAFAERRFNRVLRTPEMEDAVSASLSSGTITLPTDFLALRSAYLSTDPKTMLEQLTLAQLRGTYSAAATGKPQNYALQSGSEMVFGPSPDTTYTVVINYYKAIPALGGSQATNWLLTSHPDLYLYAALLHAEFFGWNDERLPLIKGAVDEMMAELRALGIQKAASAAPQRIRSSVVV
jgi:hypothetical protein